LQKSDRASFRRLSDFIALHALTVMHGSAVLLEDGQRADLTAGFDNTNGQLEIKAKLTLTGLQKPVVAATCLFWTSLRATTHCTPNLMEDASRWSAPLEINCDGRLAAFE
jgi:hypothetical protein